LGKRLRLSDEEVNLVYKSRAGEIDDLNYNLSHNSSLDDHLKERGIDKKDVVSVKHWQNMGGELRFSVVTKTNQVDNVDVFKNVLNMIEDYAPTYSKIKHKGGENLLVINPADIHIGKYASERETGEEYNMDIAVERVLTGVSGLISQAKGFSIDRVLFCIGNDILHTDNVMSSTTRGTYQDTDGKWWQHYEVALQVYVACVEMLRDVAPVDCVHSMSNHDYQSGFHLAHALKAWFRNCDDVTIDAGVANRKYYKYGSNLIGLEHGDGAKMDKLPLLMAQEKPQDWADTTHRYWYLHHLHHKIKHKWLDAKDFIGVTVEYMRSPSSADSWHAGKGFCGVPRAVEGFIHDKESGQVARLTHYF
tara:strand:+ start:14366 stop:15451 length:1086 start_codon:yes stop_codon:yes gene_type:complete